MTEDAERGVDTQPAPDLAAGDGDRDSAAQPDGSGDGAGAVRTGPPRRRRRRGGRGRGRGGARAPGASASPDGDGAEAGEPAEADGEADEPRDERPARASAAAPLDTAAETEGSGDGEVAAGGATRTGPARRRRRRGGRGRGRGASARTGTAAAAETTEAEVAEDEPIRADAERASGESGRAPAEPSDDQAEADPANGDGEAGTAPRTPARRRRSRARRPATRADDAAEEAGGQEPAAADTGDEAPPKRATASSRGGRSRSTGRRTAAGAAPKADAEAPAKADEAPATTRRRSTRRGTKAEPSDDGGPTRVRRSRSTTGTRRRRDTIPVIDRGTDKLMLITEHGERDQIAVVEERQLIEHYITRVGAHSMVGNIYLGRVQNVLPGMEAAFIDVGRGRNAVLYAGEVSYDEEVEGRPPRIEQVIRPGQAVMVQVTKDPIGGKGPRLTQEVSLPGRYLVLVPNSQVFGISRRLPDNERRRLRAAIRKVRPEQHGVIVRTAAEGASAEDLEADLKRLAAEWEVIAKKAKKAKAPAVLYEEPELTLKVVRDLFNDEEFREIVTDSQRVLDLVREYLTAVAPELVEKVRLHDGRLPIFEQFHVIEQIHKALDRKVWLPSGGYIVIDRTEAMTVIDVNTGKHVGSKNLEETVVRTNLEAAEEVARQLRLRDIGGMILVDFIDMLLEQNKDKVIDTIRQALAKDKTRSQVFDISPLGILEITRKRISGGLLESFSETCPTCGGRGILLTHDL